VCVCACRCDVRCRRYPCRASAAAKFAGEHTPLQHTAPHGNTRRHTAANCNTLQHTVTHYNTLQRSGCTLCRANAASSVRVWWVSVAVYCSVLQWVAVCWHPCRASAASTVCVWWEYATTTQHNTLQHTALHCNPLICDRNTAQHTATYCITLQPMDTWLQHSTTHCNILQHTATLRLVSLSSKCSINCVCVVRIPHCNTRQHSGWYPCRASAALTVCVRWKYPTAAHHNTLQHSSWHPCRASAASTVFVWWEYARYSKEPYKNRWKEPYQNGDARICQLPLYCDRPLVPLQTSPARIDLYCKEPYKNRLQRALQKWRSENTQLLPLYRDLLWRCFFQ